MLLSWDRFSGVAPKISPRKLPVGMAQTALNTDLTSRTIKGWNDVLAVVTGLTDSSPSSIYRFGLTLTGDSQYWFHWLADVDAIKGAVANDTTERTFITHPTYGPIVTNNTLALTKINSTYSVTSNVVTVTCVSAHALTVGDSVYLEVSTGTMASGQRTVASVTSATVFTVALTTADTSGACTVANSSTLPYRWHKLGVPAPTGTPTAAVQVAGNTSSQQETRVYCYTYVSSFGEESAPSPVSDALTVYTTGGTVRVSGMGTTAPAGYGNITAKRVYRTLSGSVSTEFQFIDEIPITQATYDDAILGADLQEIIPSVNYSTPPTGAFGVTSMANGITLLFSGYDVWPSEAYLPFTYPAANMHSLDYPIVGGKGVGSSAIILTTGYPYLLSGSDPAAMSLVKLDVPQACVAKRSIAAFTGGVAYASPDGLIFISTSGQVTNVTESMFSRAAWQALVPTSMTGYMQDGRYIGFYNTGSLSGGFVVDPAQGDATFSFISTYATGGYVDTVQDALFLKVGTTISKFAAGGGVLQASWRSGVVELPTQTNPACAQVKATTYPVTFKLYADGVLKHTQTVADINPFWLPSGYKASTVEIALEVASGEVTGVFVGSSTAELQGV